MLRTALLGGNTITLDADLSKYIETLTEQGIIDGLEVSSGLVAAGKAWVKATRSNGETIMTLVQNTEALAVDTSGTKKIWLEIKQEAIDNGALNNEDGTGIAEIKTGTTLPSQNFLLIATVTAGQVKDERNLIPKIQSVAQRTDSLEEKLSTAEGQISQLVEAGTPSYLGKIMTVGEVYQEGDEMYEKNGKLYKRYSIKNVNNITYSGNYQGIDCGQYTVENGELVRVEIGNFNVPGGHNIHLVFTDSEYYYDNPYGFSGKKYGEIRLYGGESGKKIAFLSGYSGGSVFVTAGHNGSYITATISNIKFITKKTGEGISFYPREIKGVDEKVECTIIGLHSDGNYIGSKKMPINKSIEGRASAEWTAPANGLLEFQYYTSNAFSFLNNRMLHERRGGDMPHYLYVTSGEIVRISVDDKGRSGTGTYKTTLLSFIPL